MKNYIVVHHTVSNASAAELAAQKKYHRIIDLDGKIYYSIPYGAPGGATFMTNSQTINIALHGNFDFHDPSNHALASLRSTLRALLIQYPHAILTDHQNMGARFTPVRFRYKTACCGVRLRSWLSRNFNEFRRY